MSISYEEALSTLQSMFSSPWTVGTLDLVLRHHKGHMENTVDMILAHGDQDPEVLIRRITTGSASSAPLDTSVALDESLARQLSQQANVSHSSTPSEPPQTARKGRGVPTILPDDFLRVPSQQKYTSTGGSTNSGSIGNNSTLDSDAALARMLQDELFSQELARNPDFAHLARGRPRTSGGVPVGTDRAPNRYPAGQSTSGPPPDQQGQMPQIPDIMGKISELGKSARDRLNLMAAQFKANNNNNGTRMENPEYRGLLANRSEDEGMELAARKDL